MFNHVLQVGKTSPNVAMVLHRVCPWARVPVPTRNGGKHVYVVNSKRLKHEQEHKMFLELTNKRLMR